MNENVNVCVTPKGDKPVLHFSQFDNGRIFTVTVLADDGESAAVLTDVDIEFRLRKTDSHVVTVAPESVTDNVITFKTTEQMCACCGQNIASVVLMDNDTNIISTLDILVDIQRDILSGGLTSESDIRNLTTQIEQIVPEVIGDDYYNKQEVDDLLAEHTFDPSNYYDKSDVDGLLADKADSDDVYTKAETDNLLADKADVSDLPDMSDYYTKTETDNLLDAKLNDIGYNDISEDAAIISFNTDCNAPLAIIKGKITPVQSGTGTPTPSNPRPIIGYSALNVTRTGKNLLNIDNFVQRSGYSNLSVSYADKDITISGYDAGGRFACFNVFTEVGKSYTVKYTSRTNISDCRITNSDTKPTAWISGGTTLAVNTAFTFTSAKPWYQIWVELSADNAVISELQIENGSAATDFEAYNGEFARISFGQTIYGGVADITNGKVTITHGYLFVDGSTSVVSIGQASGLNYVIVSNTGIDSINTSATHPIVSNEFDSSTIIAVGNAYITGNGKTLVAILPDQTVTTVAQANTWFSNNNAQFVYELATPIEITASPVTVSSIAGANNVFLDTGNLTEIAYFEGAEDNLVKLIKACKI